MKKISFLLMAFGLMVTSCTKDDFDYSYMDSVKQNYNDLFTLTYGDIDPNHDWGFHADATNRAMRGTNRSQVTPEVPDINLPYDEAWVTNYLATAKEPNSDNVTDNYDNSYVASCQWYADGNGILGKLLNNYDWCTYDGVSQADKDWYTENIKPMMDACNKQWNNDSNTAYTILMKLKEYTGDYNYWGLIVNSAGGVVIDETFVLNFKITGTWSGAISVVATEGYTDGVANGYERTVVVTGTWNVTADQRIGALGKIIVANGGTINVSEGKSLQFVNEGRFVVLPGGKVTGKGTVEVTNGNAAGMEGYNGGTIDVGEFNNNFGKFYNYGTLKADVLAGGAGLSNLYNHNLVVIGTAQKTGDDGGKYYATPNTRVFNACQFYVKEDLRLRNYEGIAGSSLIVDGELMFSGGTDGTSDPSYVALAAGALIKCGELYNNGTSWDGPTENGYAVLSMGKITFLNWEQDAPETGGYFANNIYVHADDWTNAPGGNGMGGENAAAKFEKVRNAAGNGNVTVVDTGDYEVIPADGDYEKGKKGCTPGFKITEPDEDPDPTPEPDPTPDPTEIVYAKRIIAEDLAAGQFNADFDFNDVVFDAVVKVEQVNDVDHYVAYVQVLAAGGTLPLYIGEVAEGREVHKLFGEGTGTMINTGLDYGVDVTTTPKIDGIDLGPVGNGARDADALVKKINDIPVIVVSSTRGQYELKTDLIRVDGEEMNAPMKIAVPTTYQWTKERKEVSTAYPMFKSYVGNKSVDWTNDSKKKTELLYK